MFEPDRHPDHPVVVHWQSLVDRGLIGGAPPMASAVGGAPPMASAVRERILAAEAVLCPRRRAGAVW